MNQVQAWCADKVFVVTGSTQGIGAEGAVALARAGARGVGICGRSAAGGCSAAEKTGTGRAGNTIIIPI